MKNSIRKPTVSAYGLYIAIQKEDNNEPKEKAKRKIEANKKAFKAGILESVSSQ